MIRTSHYTPEDLKDAKTKAAFRKDLKGIAKNSGGYYLDMTTGFFFPG